MNDQNEIDKLILAFEERELEANERNALIGAMAKETVFETLSKFSDRKLELLYGTVAKFAPQRIGTEPANRLINFVGFEITRRENDRAFKSMKGLTLVAIALSIISAAMGLVQTYCTMKQSGYFIGWP